MPFIHTCTTYYKSPFPIYYKHNYLNSVWITALSEMAQLKYGQPIISDKTTAISHILNGATLVCDFKKCEFIVHRLKYTVPIQTSG